MRRNPGFGESSLGAIVGAAVGSVGGLFAIGIARVIFYHDITELIGNPRLALISWVISIVTGWCIAGQLGPRLRNRFRSQRAEIVGGAIGGLLPVILIALWGWWFIGHAANHSTP